MKGTTALFDLQLHLEPDIITGMGLRWDGHLRHLAAFKRSDPAYAGIGA